MTVNAYTLNKVLLCMLTMRSDACVFYDSVSLLGCYNRNGQCFTLITKFNLLAQVVQKIGSATH